MSFERGLQGLLMALISIPVPAALAEGIQPMDTSVVDPALFDSFYGSWVIADQTGARTCKVELDREPAIGGSAISIDTGCPKTFPVMDEIAAWRLMENWGIDLVDATRKTRVRFTTPDAAYVADPEVDGIFTILRPEAQ